MEPTLGTRSYASPKHRTVRLLPCGLLISLLLVPSAWPQRKLSTAGAKDHGGEQATVCGKVASTRYAVTTRGKPTFLNLDKPYPNQVFTVLIWGENREKFGTPEEKYRDKQVCVTGKITEYRGAPEIVVSDPQSIEIEK